MQSYLSNRHYYSLTQLLPLELRGDQPQHIYYRTSVNEANLKLLADNQKNARNYRNSYLQEHILQKHASSKGTLRKKMKFEVPAQELNALFLYNSVAQFAHRHTSVLNTMDTVTFALNVEHKSETIWGIRSKYTWSKEILFAWVFSTKGRTLKKLPTMLLITLNFRLAVWELLPPLQEKGSWSQYSNNHQNLLDFHQFQ